SSDTLPAVVEGDARERLVTAGGVRRRAPAAAALTFARDLGLGRRIEVDGGGTRLRVVPRQRRPAGKAARRRRAGPGGRGRRRAVVGCVRASPGADLAWGDEQNKNIKPAPRHARGRSTGVQRGPQ